MSLFDKIFSIPKAVVTDAVRAVVDPLGEHDEPDDLGNPLLRALIPGASAVNELMKDDDD